MQKVGRNRQKGAVIITVALFTLFLLGFMGIALDFGRLFVVKTELQTAMDSCALAASQDLDAGTDVVARATSAGVRAGNLNKVMFQRDQAGLVDADVEFSETLTGVYRRGIASADAKYVRCSRQINGIAPLLLQAFSGFTGDAQYSQPQAVRALAVATRISSQTNCAVPVGVCAKDMTKPLWGFEKGEWIEGVRGGGNKLAAGKFGWLDFTPNTGGGTTEIRNAITNSGQCDLPGNNTEVDNGAKTGAEAAWNTRFGIYQGTYNKEPFPSPDFTGRSWYSSGSASDASTKALWSRFDTPGPAGYAYHQNLNTPYNDSQTGLSVYGKNPKIEPLTGVANRRVITAGIISGCDVGTLKVEAFGCFLMINPIDNKPATKMWVEFIGDASAIAGNPCSTAGLPGGVNGPRVPALVQ